MNKYYLKVVVVVLLIAHASIVLAQLPLSGTVTDKNGPLQGVTVTVKGTPTAVQTADNGQYQLQNIPADGMLIFSLIGYEQLEVPVNNRLTIDVSMLEDVSALDEVIVVGYGTQKKSQLTGSIASVSAQDLQEMPITDAAQGLQGRAAGVMVLSSGNRPGDGVTVRVRGQRSLTASNDPLYVVDGIPLEGGINDINPRDIESMEVLKDASATAIYGSRGANGVVLITTKGGGDFGRTNLSYSGYAGLTQVIGVPDMMTGPEFAKMKEISGFDFSTMEQEAIEKGIETDWLDLVLRNGLRQDHQIGIRGGNETTQFALSGGLFNESGVVKTQDFNRKTFRVNLNHNVTDRFRVGTSAQLSHRTQNVGDNVVGIALPSRPLGPAYDENGNIVQHPGGDDFRISPLRSLEKNTAIDETQRMRIFGKLFAEYQFSENFKYLVNFGVDLIEQRQGVYQGQNIHGSLERGSDFASKAHQRDHTYTLENILNYQKEIDANNTLDVTGLYSFQLYKGEYSYIAGRNLPYAHQLFHNIGSAGTVQSIASNLSEWGLMSFMGRVNYRFKERYLFTLTGRYDGSSRFSENNKWGLFPSASVGWRVIDEPFMAAQSLFSNLMLRASYGVTGNTAISPYQTRGALSRTPYSFGSDAAFGFSPSALSNSELKWERSGSTNIGLDMAFLKGQLRATIELYQTNTSDLLLSRVLPITSGYNSVLQNIGKTRNKGFEVNVSSDNIDKPNMQWTTDINLFANKEEIVEIFGGGVDDIGNRWFIGHPISVWYDYEKTGIWQTSESTEAARYGQQPGDIKVRDVDNDGIINERDLRILGSNIPTFNVSMGNRFKVNNFDLSFFIFGSFGHTLYNDFEVGNSTMVGRYNNLNVDYWTPTNPTNAHPRPDGSIEYPLYSASRGYMPGDFVKLRNVQAGYNFSERQLSMLRLRSLRVYINVENPLIFSRIAGYLDPEEAGGRLSGNTPNTRLFSVGVNIDF